MRDLVTKIGRFCESHVEKIVLVLAGAVCVWLFFTRVIFSPSVVTLEGKNFTPGQIDEYIYKQKVPELRVGAGQDGTNPANPVVYRSPLTATIDPNDPIIAGLFNRPLAGGFTGLFQGPLDFIATAPVPKPAPLPPAKAHAGRKYRLPRIPDVTDVAASHLRAAAYVPLEEIAPEKTYDKVAVEPNDVDLVTVEAKVDVAELYRRFQASFNGVDVLQEQWRDPCLADPIFAAVQLERQELQENGTWGAWQEVPRSRIDAHRKLFQVIEKVEDLPPGGLEVRLMQFDEKLVTMELLQPEAYQIASTEEDWFPPSFYDKFKTLQRRAEAEERRQQREKEQDKSTTSQRESTTRGGAYGGTTGRTPRGRGTTGIGGATGDGLYGTQRGGRTTTGRTDPSLDPQTRTGRGRTTPRRAGPAGDAAYAYPDETYPMPGTDLRRKTSTNEAYIEFAEQMITYRTDLSKWDKPLLLWALDDTVEPGASYRYRLRLGVFNPVAGTTQLAQRDLDKKDQVILWSNYSDVTAPLEIRDRFYLFAKDVQDRTKTATVEVARYTLGYWRCEDFQVKLGESIGKEVEKKPEEKKPSSRLASAGRITDPRLNQGMPDFPGMDYLDPMQDKLSEPQKVDYRTGKLLVDLVEVYAPSLNPRPYFDMLYTSDGMDIEHMPVSAANWPKSLMATYQYIRSEKRREPQEFRAFNKGGLGGRGRRGMPGGYEDMGTYDEMMYDMGGMEGPYNY